MEELARLKTSMLSQYLAHKFWDWTGGDLSKGRDVRLRHEHTEDARKLFLQLLQLIRLQLYGTWPVTEFIGALLYH